MVGLALAVFQQVTGINTVIYFAPTIMGYAGLSSVSVAILATAGVGLVNMLQTIVAICLVDRLGRRPLLLGGMVEMVVGLFVLGLAFAAPGYTRS
jgi:MFS family permease